MTLDRATFERVRDDLLEKRAAIDRTVEALNFLLADDLLMSPRIVVESVTPAKAIAPAPPKALPARRLAPTGVNHPEYDPDHEKKAKAMFIAGKPVRTIAAALGRSMQTIYTWSCHGKWARERATAQASKGTGQPLSDPTAERIRAQRRAADDAIIEQVREEMEAAAAGADRVNSFGEDGPRPNSRRHV